ncbi:hypothetical protein [Thiohalobacter sp. COW1]|uniref:hypothetical protein n=1 Tax=Thiohalobacter sp. COW1 TaxID=2795687 RepID=UPI001F5B280B|nr:hypothetical protein [Thiohalobacter sp. COW1]
MMNLLQCFVGVGEAGNFDLLVEGVDDAFEDPSADGLVVQDEDVLCLLAGLRAIVKPAVDQPRFPVTASFPPGTGNTAYSAHFLSPLARKMCIKI